MKAVWKLKDGVEIGDFIVYNDGCAEYRESWDSLSESYSIRVLNDELGHIREVVDSVTQKVVYRGDLDEDGKRRGGGFEFDGNSDKPTLEGIWMDDKLKSIIRIFEGNKMIEFMSSADNLEVSSRVPIYVGEYHYNKIHNTCCRNGNGFLINENGVAITEGKWKDGIEVETTVMRNGWYKLEEDSLNLPLDVKTIEVPAYKQKYVGFLDLNKYKKLKTIDIQEYNFCNTETFAISGSETLETVKIGDHCFYRENRTDRMNCTFTIDDCRALRSIYIGLRSFMNYSGGFELRELPELETLQIGKVGVCSDSFSYCNFVAKSNNLQWIYL